MRQAITINDNKRTWATPELHYDGLLSELVQSGGKTISGTGDGPDPFQPKKGA